MPRAALHGEIGVPADLPRRLLRIQHRLRAADAPATLQHLGELADMVDLAPDIGVVVVDILTLGGKGAVRILYLDLPAVGEAELLVITAVDEADVILRQCLRLPDGAAADVRIAEVFQGGQAHLCHIAATQRPALQPRRSN